MNHYRCNLTARIQQGDSTRKEFFFAGQWRAWVQSAFACWLHSFPRELDDPCCDLKWLGGDGTSIGTSQKRGTHLRSIWKPQIDADPDITWGRGDRAATTWISATNDPKSFVKVNQTTIQAKRHTEALKYALELLKSDDLPVPSQVELNASALLPSIRGELLRWCGLTAKSPEREPLKQLLKISLSSESVTGAIPRILVDALLPVLNLERSVLPTPERRAQAAVCLDRARNDLLCHGVGPHILKILEVQLSSSDVLQDSIFHSTTFAFISQLVGASIAIFDLINRSCVHDSAVGGSGCSLTSGCSNPNGHGASLHNPAVTGFDYNWFAKLSQGCERGAWPEPKEGGKFVYFDVSGSDCKKKRMVIIGHRARCSLWVWTCMIHHRVVAYHIIKRGEGKRDAIISLYRFKKDPPTAVFVDFACQAEESGLNWLVDYYKDVRFFHDTFHGYGHKCSSRFSSRGLKGIPAANTSIMEQFNAFLQPLRGILSSGQTRVNQFSYENAVYTHPLQAD